MTAVVTDHPVWHLPLTRALDETAFEAAELSSAIQRGIAIDEQCHELAGQLRALAGRLETHGGIG